MKDRHKSGQALGRAVAAFTFVPAILGPLVVLGWLMDLDILKNPFPGQPPIAVTTSICMVLGCVGVWGMRSASAKWRRAAVAASSLQFVIAALVFVHYCGESSFDLDQMLSPKPLHVGPGFSPGRMALNTSVAMVALSLSILFATLGGRLRAVAPGFVTVLFVIAGGSLLGYLYGEPHLYGIGVLTPMALPTALALFSFACAICCTQPEFGVMRLLRSTGEGGYLGRRLLVAAVVLPVVLGYARIVGEHAGILTPGVGISLMVLAMILFFTMIVYSTAKYIDRMSQERDRLRDKALESARIKTEFLANMSHEIRTPMNAVIGSADMLARTQLTAEQQRFVDIINTSGNSLLHIINDILLLSKIEAGKHQREETEFNLGVLIRNCAQLFEARMMEKRVALRVELAPEVKAEFIGECQPIQQILTNLIGNAVKFTDSGSVTINAAVVDVDPDTERHVVRIDVVDTGVGITPEQVDSLFQPFAQADGSITRKFGGTGLGLAISKRLAELMGGKIEVASGTAGGDGDTAHGSTFTLVVPLVKVAKSTQTAATTLSVPCINHFANALPLDASKHILLVEDTQVNQEIAKHQLRALGFGVVICSNGAEAVQTLAKRRFPMVLMDCQMPVMDGYEATRVIREREAKTGIHTPIIAMTANAMEGDAQKCLDAGMDDYISKPVTVDALRGIVEKWFLVALDREDLKEIDVLKPLQELFGFEEAVRFLAMFLKQAPEQLHEMQVAIDKFESSQLYEVAHSLRGSAAALGFAAIAEIAENIEINSSNLIVCTNELSRLNLELSALQAKAGALVDFDEIAADDARKMRETGKVRLFVVEDNDLTRDAIISILSKNDDFIVIGECDDGVEAVNIIEQKKPDIALFDLGLPGIRGNEAIEILRSKVPALKSIMLTADDTDEELFKSFAAGAQGYITKRNFNQRQLELAIRTVHGGNCWLDPTLARRVLEAASSGRDVVPPLNFLAPDDAATLRRIAEQDAGPACDGNVCSVDSSFLLRLKRLAPITE